VVFCGNGDFPQGDYVIRLSGCVLGQVCPPLSRCTTRRHRADVRRHRVHVRPWRSARRPNRESCVFTPANTQYLRLDPVQASGEIVLTDFRFEPSPILLVRRNCRFKTVYATAVALGPQFRFCPRSEIHARICGGAGRQSWGRNRNAWRVSHVCWAAQQGSAVPGDFIEWASAGAGSALTVIDYLNFTRSPAPFTCSTRSPAWFPNHHPTREALRHSGIQLSGLLRRRVRRVQTVSQCQSPCAGPVPGNSFPSAEHARGVPAHRHELRRARNCRGRTFLAALVPRRRPSSSTTTAGRATSPRNTPSMRSPPNAACRS